MQDHGPIHFALPDELRTILRADDKPEAEQQERSHDNLIVRPRALLVSKRNYLRLTSH